MIEVGASIGLAAYASHPEHLRVKREFGDLRVARHQVDYAAPAADREEQTDTADAVSSRRTVVHVAHG